MKTHFISQKNTYSSRPLPSTSSSVSSPLQNQLQLPFLHLKSHKFPLSASPESLRCSFAAHATAPLAVGRYLFLPPCVWFQLFPVQTPFGSRAARLSKQDLEQKASFLFRRSKRSQVQIQSCCICGKLSAFARLYLALGRQIGPLCSLFEAWVRSRSSIWGGACKLVWKILITRELVKVLVVAQFSYNMSFRSIVRDVRESFGSLSRRGFEVRISGLPGLSGHHRGKSVGSLSELHNGPVMVDQSGWAGLPPELLRDVMKRLEEGESTWPSRKDVVACAAACKAWREICKDIVQSPEFCGKLTFPLSLKQPGPRDGLIQCFIKRDKSTLTYHLYLCLSPAVLSENGKFLLAAKRNRRTTYTEYIISVDSKNISRSSNGYVGKMRSNFLGTKFIVYDTQPPYNAGSLASCQRASRRISSRRVSPKVPTGSYPVAQVNYELNVLGTRGPRRMQCTMHSIPASALEPEGVVPGQPKQLLPGPFEESFRSTNTSSRFSITDFSSSRFSEISEVVPQDGDGEAKERPLVLCNKVPRWHEQLQCWCLNFRGRVTVASVKNFQLTAAPQPAAVLSESSQPPQQQAQPSSSSSSPSDHEKVILQFGKVTKDMFTMDYRYPLSAFQAFAICLTSFDTKLACE